MYRKNVNCFFKKPPIIFTCDQIGIGMSVTMLPIILDIKKSSNQEVYIHCHQHHVDILKYFIDEENIYPFYDSNDPQLKNDKIFVGEKAREVVIYNSSVTIHAPHKCHPVDHFYNLWTGEINVSNERKNYPKFPVEKVDVSKFNLPEKFVVIGPGSTKPICQIPANPINDIIDYCKFKDYDVVLLGDKYSFNLPVPVSSPLNFQDTMTVGPEMHSALNYNKCINLIEKTSLDEAIAILDKAQCYIGPEGGLMQFCGMTDTPMIISINGWHPDMRMPYRHNELGWECYPIVPDADLECRYCIQRTIHARTVNVMMDCIYKDFKCVEDIIFDKFKPHIDKIL